MSLPFNGRLALNNARLLKSNPFNGNIPPTIAEFLSPFIRSKSEYLAKGVSPMASDRRSFLRLVSSAGAAGAVLSFPPVAISRVSAVARHLNGLAPEEVAKDEDFWVQVQQAFDLDSRYIALNNGANNGAARTTLAA